MEQSPTQCGIFTQLIKNGCGKGDSRHNDNRDSPGLCGFAGAMVNECGFAGAHWGSKVKPSPFGPE